MVAVGSRFGLLQRVDGHPSADLVQDVIQHLGNLLNVKRGYGSFRPDLGLSISDTMWSARPLAELATHIRTQIERFEPRLRNPRVEPGVIDDHLCPSFRVHGSIGNASVILVLSLHTVYCSVHVTQE
jgi:predicted component of type VI protein secretion system